MPHLSENELMFLDTSSDEVIDSCTLHGEDALSGKTMVVKSGVSPVLPEPLSSGDPSPGTSDGERKCSDQGWAGGHGRTQTWRWEWGLGNASGEEVLFMLSPGGQVGIVVKGWECGSERFLAEGTAYAKVQRGESG